MPPQGGRVAALLYMMDWKRDPRHLLAYTIPRDGRPKYNWLFKIDTETGRAEYVRGGCYYFMPWECPYADRYVLYDYSAPCLRLYEAGDHPQQPVFLGEVRRVMWVGEEELVVEGVAQLEGTGETGLYLVRLGSAPVKLSGPGWGLPAMTPSPLRHAGGLVPVMDRRRGKERAAVGTVQVHTCTIESLTDPDAVRLYADFAAFALNGEVLVFLRLLGRGSDLWAVRLADRALLPITRQKGVGTFVVSPDGQKIAYAHKEKGTESVFIMTLNREAILSAAASYE